MLYIYIYVWVAGGRSGERAIEDLPLPETGAPRGRDVYTIL